MKFIYCLDEFKKVELIKDGYKFLNEITYNGQTAYLFANNKDKQVFANDDKIIYSNRLTF